MAYSDVVEVGLPAKLERRRTAEGMEITRRWFGWQVVFMTAFAAFWDGFLVVWYMQAGKSGDLMMVLFPLIHVGVGVGITYHAFIGWFNRTHIVFSPRKLTIAHRPFPWIGSLELNARTLKQLYSKERISRGRNGTSVTYEVHAVTKDGRSRRILGGLENSEQALYIEQEIESYLGIEDRPVRGEIGR